MMTLREFALSVEVAKYDVCSLPPLVVSRLLKSSQCAAVQRSRGLLVKSARFELSYLRRVSSS